MPNGISQALSALDPQAQLATVQAAQGQQRLAQQNRRLDLKEAQNEIQNQLQKKRLDLQKKEFEAQKEYQNVQTQLNKQKLNRLKIKNQVFQQLNDRMVQTPAGQEYTALEAITMGIDLSPEDTKTQFDITTADGQRVGIFYDLQNQTIKKVPIGAEAEKPESLKKYQTFQGKMESGREALKENLGINIYQRMSREQSPKLADMTDLTSGYIAQKKDPTVSANQAFKDINRYYDKVARLSEFEGDRFQAIEATKETIKDAEKIRAAMQEAEDQGTTPSNRFTRDHIESALNKAGYDQEEAASVVDAAISQILEERK